MCNLRPYGLRATVPDSDDVIWAAWQCQVRQNVGLMTRLQPWVRNGLGARIREFVRDADLASFDRAELRKLIREQNVLTRGRLES